MVGVAFSELVKTVIELGIVRTIVELGIVRTIVELGILWTIVAKLALHNRVEVFKKLAHSSTRLAKCFHQAQPKHQNQIAL